MQYLQIAFDAPKPLYGVILQGSPIFDQYVTSFKILHSFDGVAFHYLVDETTKPQVFSGPIDSRTPVKSMFKIPIEAKVIRIYPLTWHGSISIRAELLGCSPVKVIDVVTEAPHHVEIIDKPMCDDPFGVESGELHSEQIALSSHNANISIDEAKASLKLSSPIGWHPNLDSPNEYVVFDFLQLRNVTGIKTSGGIMGWVSAYNIRYTQDMVVWNKILVANAIDEKLFLANFDGRTPKTNYFEYPIQARAIKILPIKWHDRIELKVEPIGCFIPYDLILPKIPPKVIENLVVNASSCNICPGIDNHHLIEGTCACHSLMFWNGNECVSRNTCPCVENHLIYGIGAMFEKEDCSQCICVLGGVPQCKPKDCQPCEKGLRRVQSACLCDCEPCPPNHVLCQTSGACILESAWCNGVQDCPDDEISCSYKLQAQTKTVKKIKEKIIITETCPQPKCPPGFYVKIHASKKAKSSPMLYSAEEPNEIDAFYKNSIDGDKYKSKLALPNDMESKQRKHKHYECVEFDCIPEKPIGYKTEKIVCPEPSCPNGYNIVFESSKSFQACAKYKCELQLKKDVVCNITGRTFNTFDEVEYKYDVCDHILARDLLSNNWTISRKCFSLFHFYIDDC